MSKKKRVLIVCHDAGGANILASLMEKYRRDFDWVLCAFGPAKDIFSRKNIKSYIDQSYRKNNLENILKSKRPDLLLTGTSWESDMEINFIKTAKKNNIKTASFIDHWCNYKGRFGYPGNWRINLPDFIFVGDKWAYKLALKNGFPKNILFQVENPYFEESIKQAIRRKKDKIKKSQDKKIKILYVSEARGQTEYEIVKDLLKIIKSQQAGVLLELKIRLHPAEKTNKYSNLLKNQKYRGIRRFISISDPASNLLVDDCIWADMVIGSATMALVIASMIGNKTISYIPTDKQSYSLPQKEIKKIYSREKLLQELKNYKMVNSYLKKNYRFQVENLFKQKIYKIIDMS